ncbi:glycosyltransferase [Pedosphaera parvula]|uniref:Glycosyl transferase family 2 n=1 Tax=Pedosphaera parvula (strain Ellin514) TaxID=320771 RepID=B9XD35_PEDPL|nr:glycosyltransferase family 2 protein [Pedosphaera parvula]EEF62381.1 glycosyl transferase family 2 [Pedosphaera parvula Ellin514]
MEKKRENFDCSVIICTRNCAPSLEKTLQAMGGVCVPAGWRAELIVVDNASTDNTARVARSAQLKNFEVRYLYEEKAGKSNALNSGVAAAQGEVILFTDDDVIPVVDWLDRLATPLLKRKCDAVVGRIELAESLLRPWMDSTHKLWLAAPDLPPDGEVELIGANMGFHRSVLKSVPKYDPELGPGASGFGEETVFSWQLCAAGLRLKSVPEALVVHHPAASRLLRSQWLAAAHKRGKSLAYMLHHWKHGEIRVPAFRAGFLKLKLLLRRMMQPPPPLDGEGAPSWEMSYVAEIEMCRQFLKERRRSRNYEKKGLVKLRV